MVVAHRVHRRQIVRVVYQHCVECSQREYHVIGLAEQPLVRVALLEQLRAEPSTDGGLPACFDVEAWLIEKVLAEQKGAMFRSALGCALPLAGRQYV